MIIREIPRPEPLFSHLFAEDEGYLVTFTGQQARITDPEAPANQLVAIRQRSWRYPSQAEAAARYLLEEAAEQRDAYVGVHLFRKSGSRLAANAVEEVWCLWLDEDEGRYPHEGPEPTAAILSSAKRRHLYWRLTRPLSSEWAVVMNRRLAAFSSGDTGKAALASVLRVPGTKNFKRHPQVDEVRAIYTDEEWEPEILEQAIPELGTTGEAKRRSEPYDGPELDIAGFLAGVEVFGRAPDSSGIKLRVLCPWVHEHTGGDPSGTYAGQLESGTLYFVCHHSHCHNRGWREFREAIGEKKTVEVRRDSADPGDNTKIKKVRLHRG